MAAIGGFAQRQHGLDGTFTLEDFLPRLYTPAGANLMAGEPHAVLRERTDSVTQGSISAQSCFAGRHRQSLPSEYVPPAFQSSTLIPSRSIYPARTLPLV